MSNTNHWLLAIVTFVIAYLINVFYITVLYHRGLAHGSVELSPWTRKWVIRTGAWITGIDPKAWACMHRLHHQHSDTEQDPHSPWHYGLFGVMVGQLKSYEKTLGGLLKGKPETLKVVRDLDFPVSWTIRKGVWWLPYVLHLGVAAVLAVAFHSWLLGTGYFAGMMSHPAQGWLVNSFAHRFGYQNHDNRDESRNNTLVAWLVFGEGYQNNHHARPGSAKFSERWFEFDGGFVLCRLAQSLGILKIAIETK